MNVLTLLISVTRYNKEKTYCSVRCSAIEKECRANHSVNPPGTKLQVTRPLFG
jgi:hypothetical protein